MGKKLHCIKTTNPNASKGGAQMRATVLVDNEAQGLCESEWDLSILIEHREHATLLDAGASGLFAENARKLDIDLAAVNVAALSHAHYDHSDGFDAFFQVNDTAKLFVAASARENCYDIEDGKLCYIGVSHGLFARHAHRIEYVSRPTEIAPSRFCRKSSAKASSRQPKAVCASSWTNRIEQA